MLFFEILKKCLEGEKHLLFSQSLSVWKLLLVNVVLAFPSDLLPFYPDGILLLFKEKVNCTSQPTGLFTGLDERFFISWVNIHPYPCLCRAEMLFDSSPDHCSDVAV